MSESTAKNSIEKSRRVIVAVAKGELVDMVVDFCRCLREIPLLPLEPLHLSEEDGHLWIGLAP